MFVRRMKEMLYNYLVNRDSYIFQEYKAYRRGKQGIGRVKSWFYLLKLILFRVGKSKRNHPFSLSKNVSRYEEHSESELEKRETPEKLLEKLAPYEVISFDIFDTLLLRIVNQPSDAFFWMGKELKYPNFEQIRIEGEQKARAQKEMDLGHGEVTLAEIWQVLEEETGIDAQVGMNVELAVEKKVCFANPYFEQIMQELQELQKRGKRLIAISDMYLNSEQLKELLHHVGIPDVFEEIFVSCEHGASKSDGRLYQVVKEEMGQGTRYIHIGDNYYADIKQAKKQRITPHFYKNVSDVGAKYRPEDMSTLTGSVYSGLVNSYLHNGAESYDKAYELGFIYGGLFVLGYCRWIHDYFLRENVDKILFLARDGDILSKVYHRLFGEQTESDSWAYVPWSRAVGTKMCAKYYKKDYFTRFLDQKVNQGYSLKEVFGAMNLRHLLSDFLQADDTRREFTQLTDHNVKEVKEYLLINWETVVAEYDKELQAGGAFYRRVLSDCKKIAIVDVGWAGSGAVQLDYLINQVWQLDCEVVGLLAGTHARRSDAASTSEVFLYQGMLESYLFSPNHNRDIWEFHNPGAGHNLVVELLLASTEKSFRGFAKKGRAANRNTETEEARVAAKIQEGVLDFVGYYSDRVKDIPQISGRDAYIPIATLANHVAMVKNVVGYKWFQMNVE